MALKRPWKVCGLISALYESVVGTFLVLHIAVAFVVYELGKHLPVARSYSSFARRRQALFCSGHFPPFSTLWDCNGGLQEASGLGLSPSLNSRGYLPGRASSEDLSASGDGVGSRRAGLCNQKLTASFSSIHRRRDSMLIRPGCKGKCVAYNGQHVGEFVEGSAEWRKQQKDRGNDEVILSLLKALQAERRISRMLYEELEEERVAAETAANEAMAMILRLQEEMSALKLEAAHYRRLAEEKLFHDEQAIQLLEEDLFRKESEWRLLEEELKSLTRESAAGETKGMQSEPLYRESRKSFALLKGVVEATDMEDADVNAMSFPDTRILKLQSANDGDSEKCFEAGLTTKDKCLKRLRSLAVLEEDMDIHEWVEDKAVMAPGRQTERPQGLDEEEHDASSLLVQLFALEQQLLGLEESEPWNLFNNCFKMSTLAATHGPLEAYCEDQNAKCTEQWWLSRASEKQDGLDTLQMLRNAKASETLDAPEVLKASGSATSSEKLKVSETLEESVYGQEPGNTANYGGLSQIPDDEKVVSMDFANLNHSPPREPDTANEKVLEFDEVKHPKSKFVHWEAREEDKHLDLPSFVPSSHSGSLITQNGVEKCKLDVHDLAPDAVLVRMAEKAVNVDRVTLQGINLRLQALENENSLLRHHSVPSSHERKVLLKEIMQELQDLVKANRTAAASVNEAVPHSDAHIKGGQLKKRQYMDGPAHSS